MADSKKFKERILDAAEVGVEELIKVLQEPIKGESGEMPEPEKMKTAAQAKRVAFEDALAIVERIQEERNSLDDSDVESKVKDATNFAERWAKK